MTASTIAAITSSGEMPRSVATWFRANANSVFMIVIGIFYHRLLFFSRGWRGRGFFFRRWGFWNFSWLSSRFFRRFFGRSCLAFNSFTFYGRLGYNFGLSRNSVRSDAFFFVGDYGNDDLIRNLDFTANFFNDRNIDLDFWGNVRRQSLNR